MSGHSPTVGASQDMIVASFWLPALLRVGRWMSTATGNAYTEAGSRGLTEKELNLIADARHRNYDQIA